MVRSNHDDAKEQSNTEKYQAQTPDARCEKKAAFRRAFAL
jgi:hypothetical protein